MQYYQKNDSTLTAQNATDSTKSIEQTLELAEQRARFLRRYFKENLHSEVEELNHCFANMQYLTTKEKLLILASPIWCISDYFISPEDAEGKSIVATEVRDDRILFSAGEIKRPLSLPISFIEAVEEEAVQKMKEAIRTVLTVTNFLSGELKW